ncbi:MAG: hypothetical protein Q8S73_36595 [Deltaproteobacteria bacterium]|nr:hypothetical protein [Myxococcales bacterium]MDP3219679.1 hypothetical protein [Deltaproteobacteria bacterium]
MSDETLTEARRLLDSGDAMGAFRHLRPALAYPAPTLHEGVDFARAVGLFADVAGAIAGPELAATVAAASTRPDDVNALYDAAYALYESGLHDVAATHLDRANRLAPRQVALLSELVANLEALLRYGDAARVLDASGIVDQAPLLTYLAGYSAMMLGDLDAARRRVGQLRDAPPDVAFMRDALHGMLLRADALTAAGVALGPRSLTAWHAVINGTVLLHESPYGYDEGMSGRYAFVSDSPGLMREGVERLCAWLTAVGRRPSRVVAAPDRSSRILALATARRLQVPVVVWSPGEASDGLVVAWDLDAVGDPGFLQALHEHAPDQVLFAHASAWVAPFAYAPDVTTLLYQTITHPYAGGALRVDPATGQVGPVAADERDIAALADEVLRDDAGEASRTPLDDALAITHALAGLPAEHRLGFRRESGARRRQRAGSPVQSSRFL